MASRGGEGVREEGSSGEAESEEGEEEEERRSKMASAATMPDWGVNGKGEGGVGLG